jgi:hypothetical protein
MNLQAVIKEVTVNPDDSVDYTIQVSDDEETALVAFTAVISEPLASFLAMRFKNDQHLDAFDQVIYAIESLNFSSKLAEDLVGIEFTSSED